MIIYGTNNKIRGRNSSEMISYSVIETPELGEGVRTPFTFKDMLYDEVVSAGTKNNALIVLDNLSLEQNNSLHLEASNSKVVISDNSILWADNGYVDITVRAYNLGAKRFKRLMISDVTEMLELTGFEAGSLTKHAHDAVITLLGAQIYSKDKQQYITNTNQDLDNPDISLNPNLFTGALDFSGVSVMSTRQGDDRFPITLITNRHAIVAKHVAGSIGDEYVFKRTDGSYQKVTVTGRHSIINADDITILYFDQEITGALIYEVMPNGWESDYCNLNYDELALRSSIPVLRKSMHYSDGSFGSALQISSINSGRSVNSFTPPFIDIYNNYIVENPLNILYSEWGYKEAIGGDSGGPSFLLINGGLVLVLSQYTVSGGNNIAHHVTEINSALNDLAGVSQGTYLLQHPDLSSFNTY